MTGRRLHVTWFASAVTHQEIKIHLWLSRLCVSFSNLGAKNPEKYVQHIPYIIINLIFLFCLNVFLKTNISSTYFFFYGRRFFAMELNAIELSAQQYFHHMFRVGETRAKNPPITDDGNWHHKQSVVLIFASPFLLLLRLMKRHCDRKLAAFHHAALHYRFNW